MRHMKKPGKSQPELFPMDSSLGQDEQRGDRVRRRDIAGQRYLLPAYSHRDIACPRCGSALRPLGDDLWLTIGSALPAGKNAHTATNHRDTCSMQP